MQLRSSQQSFKQISKDTFNKFKKIRKLSSPLLGEHYLYSKDSIKYLVKQLPSDKQFNTTRPSNFNFSKYSCPLQPTTFYIYPILGIPLKNVIKSGLNLVKSNKDHLSVELSQEIKQYKNWMSRHNENFQKCLKQVLVMLLKGIHNGLIKQVFLDCIRVVNGQIIYCHDTWMHTNQQIVKSHFNQLENLFLSQNDLKQISIGNQVFSMTFNNFTKPKIKTQQSSLFSGYYKAFLLILTVTSYEFTLRNYEWSQHRINYHNIQQRIRYFKLRHSKEKLGQVLEKILLKNDRIEGEVTIAEVWNLIESEPSDDRSAGKQLIKNNSNSKRKVKLRTQSKKESSEQLNDSHCFSSVLSPSQNIVSKSKISDCCTESLQNHFATQKKKILAKNLQKSFSRSSFHSSNSKNNFQSKNKENIYQERFSQLPSSSKKLHNKSQLQNNIFSKIKAPERIKALKQKNTNSKQYKIDCSSFLIQSATSISDNRTSNLGQFSIRDTLLSAKGDSSKLNVKMLQYLNLEQYLPKSKYQENILKYLQATYVKQNFQKKIYPNKSIYLGQLCYSNVGGEECIEREGQGLYIFPSNDIYYGKWRNNQMNGFGKYIFRSGQVFVGNLQNGSKNGYGTFFYDDQRVYQGYWKDDQKIGLGVVNFPNGVRFFGNFCPSQQKTQGVFSGFCQQKKKVWSEQGFLEIYDYKTNSMKLNRKQNLKQNYRQKLLNCSAQKYFQVTDEDGNQFIGQKIHNLKNGIGVQQDQKTIFSGMFQNDERNGSGILTVKNKFQINAEWKSGMIVQYNMQI